MCAVKTTDEQTGTIAQEILEKLNLEQALNEAAKGPSNMAGNNPKQSLKPSVVNQTR